MDLRVELEKLIGDPPDDLVEFYVKGFNKEYADLEFGFLGLEQAIEYTRAIADLYIADNMGLFTLNDADDSNPFCYITKGIAKGKILHLMHDGEGRIKFNSLKDFLRECKSVDEHDIDVYSIDWNHESLVANQSALAEVLDSLATKPEDTAVELMLLYIPLLDGADVSVFERHCLHEDFYVREYLANRIVELASPKLLPVAEKLAADQHSQPAEAGKRAVSAIKRRMYQ